MKKIAMLLFTLLLAMTIAAQPAIQWQKQFGGTQDDQVYSVKPTKDGGYIAIGLALSNDGEVSGHHGGTDTYDIWVVKMDQNGDIVWQKSLGGDDFEYAFDIQQTKDEGYILAATTSSINNGDVYLNHGERDCWVVKLTKQGAIQWKKTFGTADYESGRTALQTADGGYLIGGGDSYSNYWLIKINLAGQIQWSQTYGGSGQENFGSMVLTSDKGCVMIGASWSNDGDITGHHGSTDFADYWVVKVDSMGDLQWEKSLGGSYLEQGESIITTTDGGYLVSGISYSNDGDVSGHHGPVGSSQDAWVVKLNANGSIAWQKSLGGSSDFDQLTGINQTQDGGFILGGSTGSNNGTIPTGQLQGYTDGWIVKLNSDGITEWQDLIGGSNYEGIYSIAQTVDGGYIFCGSSDSVDGDLTAFSQGLSDYWIVKMGPVSGVTNTSIDHTIGISPNPVHQTAFLSTLPEETTLSLSILNQFGQQVLSQTLQQTAPLDVSALPNGIYFVLATGVSGKVYTGKICKLD